MHIHTESTVGRCFWGEDNRPGYCCTVNATIADTSGPCAMHLPNSYDEIKHETIGFYAAFQLLL